MAAAHLIDADVGATLLQDRVPSAALHTARQMLERGFNTPMTSSVGRLFDAVAALTTGRTRVAFEGQAAMELEWLAGDHAADEMYPWEIGNSADGAMVIDTRPLIRAVADDLGRGLDASSITQRFHAALADMIVMVCARIRSTVGIGLVVLSGGVFMNALLTRLAAGRLREAGFNVYRHEKVPTNDGGLSLGQLAIAAATLNQQ
jgi:hydrogenase maturation protein HypF